jgi:hypothetical protein
MDDLREEISRLEAQIEEHAEIIERCRKIMLFSKAAIIGGGLLLLAILLGVVGADPTGMIGAIAALIGGTVLLGSNGSTSEQATKALQAAETRRAELIDQIDPRPVGQGNGSVIKFPAPRV